MALMHIFPDRAHFGKHIGTGGHYLFFLAGRRISFRGVGTYIPTDAYNPMSTLTIFTKISPADQPLSYLMA